MPFLTLILSLAETRSTPVAAPSLSAPRPAGGLDAASPSRALNT